MIALFTLFLCQIIITQADNHYKNYFDDLFTKERGTH